MAGRSMRAARWGPTRRRWIVEAFLPAAAWAWLPRRALAGAYPVTAQAMREARAAETDVACRYTEFGRRAKVEGYLGVAYLFAAFAAAEAIHADNFARVLAGLGVELSPLPLPATKPGDTRACLLAAAAAEADSVDSFYPKLLDRIRPEGHADAMTAVRWAWDTEKVHREKIAQIQRWSPSFFEQVARQIADKTGQYHVCQICGNTVHLVPPERCPVCGNPSRHFRLIDPPA
jgi:rubrerythrin